MYLNIFLFILFFSAGISAQTWKKMETKTFTIGTAGSPLTTCPTNYVLIPKLIGYTVSDFCVAKYEMKQSTVTGEAVSQAAGAPYVNINRNAAINACRARGAGYELISNEQWQTIAKNIVEVDENWSSGTAYTGILNKGHTDGTPASGQAASVDTDACYLTGQTCSNTVWHAQRRTFVLSTGDVLWDFGGNVAEWTVSGSSVSPGANARVVDYASGDTRQVYYGHNILCDAPTVSPYCNYGNGVFGTGGVIFRGGRYNEDALSGIFHANLTATTSSSSAAVGFRCVFRP